MPIKTWSPIFYHPFDKNPPVLCKCPRCIRKHARCVRKHARNGRVPTIHEHNNNKDFSKFRSGTVKSQLRPLFCFGNHSKEKLHFANVHITINEGKGRILYVWHTCFQSKLFFRTQKLWQKEKLQADLFLYD